MRRRIWLASVASFLAVGGAQAQTKPNPSFNLSNGTDTAIEEVYATSAGQTNWGRDRLGGNRILPGSSRPIRLPATGECVYDLRVVYAGGRAEQRQAVNTCDLSTITFGNNTPGNRPNAAQVQPGATQPGATQPGATQPGATQSGATQPGGGPGAANPSFNLINRGNQPIAALFAAPANQGDWGSNRLTEGGLEPGTRFAVRLPADGTCDYKLRVVFKDGETLSRRRVNLCARTDIPVP